MFENQSNNSPSRDTGQSFFASQASKRDIHSNQHHKMSKKTSASHPQNSGNNEKSTHYKSRGTSKQIDEGVSRQEKLVMGDRHCAQGKFNCKCSMCVEQTRPDFTQNVWANQKDLDESIFLPNKQKHQESRDFRWLIENLLPFNDKFKGCELIFPDTVFYVNGKPKMIVKTDMKDYCIISIKNKSKLNQQSIYKEFSSVFRERKKDYIGIFSVLYNKSHDNIQEQGSMRGSQGFTAQNTVKNSLQQASQDDQGGASQAGGLKHSGTIKQKTQLNLMKTQESNTMAKTFQQQHQGKIDQFNKKNSIENQIYYKDFCLIRYNNAVIDKKMPAQIKAQAQQELIAALGVGSNQSQQAASQLQKVLTQTDLYSQGKSHNHSSVRYLDVKPEEQIEAVEVKNAEKAMKLFNTRTNDDFWKTVSSIQLNIKSKSGCGTPFIIKFTAPVDKNDMDKEIKYDFRGEGEDQQLVRDDERKYCIKQCLKMCYYVQKMHHQEILKMRCLFVKDENCTIWFSYASEIVSRPIKGQNHVVRKRPVQYFNNGHKAILLDELEKHMEKRQQENQQKNIHQLEQVMDRQYEMIKNQVGIKDILDDSESDEDTDNVFQQLRPNSPLKFKQIIQGDFDPNKFMKENHQMFGPGSLKRLDPGASKQQIQKYLLNEGNPLAGPSVRSSSKSLQKQTHHMDKNQYAQLHENMRLVHNIMETEKANYYEQMQQINIGKTQMNQNKAIMPAKLPQDIQNEGIIVKKLEMPEGQNLDKLDNTQLQNERRKNYISFKNRPHTAKVARNFSAKQRQAAVISSSQAMNIQGGEGGTKGHGSRSNRMIGVMTSQKNLVTNNNQTTRPASGGNQFLKISRGIHQLNDKQQMYSNQLLKPGITSQNFITNTIGSQTNHTVRRNVQNQQQITVSQTASTKFNPSNFENLNQFQQVQPSGVPVRGQHFSQATIQTTLNPAGTTLHNLQMIQQSQGTINTNFNENSAAKSGGNFMNTNNQQYQNIQYRFQDQNKTQSKRPQTGVNKHLNTSGTNQENFNSQNMIQPRSAKSNHKMTSFQNLQRERYDFQRQSASKLYHNKVKNRFNYLKFLHNNKSNRVMHRVELINQHSSGALNSIAQINEFTGVQQASPQNQMSLNRNRQVQTRDLLTNLTSQPNLNQRTSQDQQAQSSQEDLLDKITNNKLYQAAINNDPNHPYYQGNNTNISHHHTAQNNQSKSHQRKVSGNQQDMSQSIVVGEGQDVGDLIEIDPREIKESRYSQNINLTGGDEQNDPAFQEKLNQLLLLAENDPENYQRAVHDLMAQAQKNQVAVQKKEHINQVFGDD